MKLLGEVLQFSASGKAIVSNPDIPKIGASVKDSEGKTVGKVLNIIGPSKRPFILVSGKFKEKDKVYL